MIYKNWFDKSIPIMGFGGIPIMFGKDSEFLVRLKDVSYEESIDVIKQAIKKGIRFFDTALDYGDSEEKIGKAIVGEREQVILATKSKSLTYDEMMYAVEKSLFRLNTDYIDLYQLHFVKDETSYHTIMGANGGYKALYELKSQGVIKEIGIASHNQEVLTTALEDECFYSFQLPYNIIEHENIKIIELARTKGVKTIIMKPFAGGTLTKIHSKLSHIIKSDNVIKGLALKFILKEQIDIVIPGISSLDELNENYNLIDANNILDDDMEMIKSITDIIGRSFCRRCQYCEPCPQGIEIAKILRFDKYYEDYNLKEWAKKQYYELTVKADKCKQCHRCESRCPYSLPIVKRILDFHKKVENENV